MRRDRKKEKENRAFEKRLESVLKKAMSVDRQTQKGKNPQLLKQAISLVDKAAKKQILHKNKAGRLKSKLSKFVKSSPPAKKSVTIKKSKKAKPSTPKKPAKKTQ